MKLVLQAPPRNLGPVRPRNVVLIRIIAVEETSMEGAAGRRLKEEDLGLSETLCCSQDSARTTATG